MRTKEHAPDGDRIKMYARVKPETRRRFKAVAELAGETAEMRLERLMEEDVRKHLTALAQ